MNPVLSGRYGHDIPGGSAWSVSVPAGRLLTLTAAGDGANVSTLIFAADRLDRLNVPDTLKAQLTATIGPPVVLMSDRGLALASVIGSSGSRHDALCGFTGPRNMDALSPTDYQHDRNAWRRNAHELFLLELAKYGMGEADLHGSVNFFSEVTAAADARCSLTFRPGAGAAGDFVTLRAEQDLLVLLATTPHPLDPTPAAPLSGIRAEITPGEPWGAGDESYRFRPESARALEQTRKAFL